MKSWRLHLGCAVSIGGKKTDANWGHRWGRAGWLWKISSTAFFFKTETWICIIKIFTFEIDHMNVDFFFKFHSYFTGEIIKKWTHHTKREYRWWFIGAKSQGIMANL